jgi:hypothetical protein
MEFNLAKFLRDEFLENFTVTEQTLDQINDFLTERETVTNQKLGQEGAEANQLLLLNYIIRFDNRGYKPNEYSDLKKYYAQANNVERIIFTLNSTQSVNTNRLHGTHFEIKIDAKDSKNTYIQVSSDDGDAVDSVFCGLLEIIKKGKNKNWLVRNTWSQLIVQVLGVAVGFVISLIAGLQATPHINIENSFVITFLFAFLIFSNAWGFINQQILRFLDYAFPNVQFSRLGKSSLHWLSQAFVGGIVVASTLLLLSKTFSWIGAILGQYIGA